MDSTSMKERTVNTIGGTTWQTSSVCSMNTVVSRESAHLRKSAHPPKILNFHFPPIHMRKSAHK